MPIKQISGNYDSPMVAGYKRSTVFITFKAQVLPPHGYLVSETCWSRPWAPCYHSCPALPQPSPQGSNSEQSLTARWFSAESALEGDQVNTLTLHRWSLWDGEGWQDPKHRVNGSRGHSCPRTPPLILLLLSSCNPNGDNAWRRPFAPGATCAGCLRGSYCLAC